MTYHGQTISLCTTCKDRSDSLLTCLPSWLELPVDEIMIVDWTSFQPILSSVQRYIEADDRVKLARVNEQKYYSHPVAKNTALRLAKCHHVLLMDCDVMPVEDLFDRLNWEGRFFYRGRGDGTTGTCLAERKEFLSVGGHNENFTTWGGHDVDMYQRLIERGLEKRSWPRGSLTHLEHDWEKRLRYIETPERADEDFIREKIRNDPPWNSESARCFISGWVYESDGHRVKEKEFTT